MKFEEKSVQGRSEDRDMIGPLNTNNWREDVWQVQTVNLDSVSTLLFSLGLRLAIHHI